MSPLTDPLGPDLKATLRSLKLGTRHGRTGRQPGGGYVSQAHARVVGDGTADRA